MNPRQKFKEVFDLDPMHLKNVNAYIDWLERQIDFDNNNDNDSVKNIISWTCAQFSEKPEDVLSRSNKRRYVEIRQVIFSIAKKCTFLSLSDLGKAVGNRNHATVMHALKTSYLMTKYHLEVKNDGIKKFSKAVIQHTK